MVIVRTLYGFSESDLQTFRFIGNYYISGFYEISTCNALSRYGISLQGIQYVQTMTAQLI